jgi:hypothetical protein
MALLEKPHQFAQLIKVLTTTESEKAFYQEQNSTWAKKFSQGAPTK